VQKKSEASAGFPHGKKSEASAGLPHGTKSEATSGFPLFKGDGRGIIREEGDHKGDGRGIIRGTEGGSKRGARGDLFPIVYSPTPYIDSMSSPG